MRRVVSEFGQICKRKKLLVNIGKRVKVMRRSRDVNVCQMNSRLNDEQLEVVDCFKYLGPKQ